MELERVLPRLFTELVHGAPAGGGAFMLNSGDAGMLASLDALTAEEASRAVSGGASIAAHAEHVRYGLVLMNEWARHGGNPFADARWDAAWKLSAVDGPRWQEIRGGLRQEAERWLGALGTSRAANEVQQCGRLGSIAHPAYHIGAIRQIVPRARGQREGTFGAQ